MIQISVMAAASVAFVGYVGAAGVVAITLAVTVLAPHATPAATTTRGVLTGIGLAAFLWAVWRVSTRGCCAWRTNRRGPTPSRMVVSVSEREMYIAAREELRREERRRAMVRVSAVVLVSACGLALPAFLYRAIPTSLAPAIAAVSLLGAICAVVALAFSAPGGRAQLAWGRLISPRAHCWPRCHASSRAGLTAGRSAAWGGPNSRGEGQSSAHGTRALQDSTTRHVIPRNI